MGLGRRRLAAGRRRRALPHAHRRPRHPVRGPGRRAQPLPAGGLGQPHAAAPAPRPRQPRHGDEDGLRHREPLPPRGIPGADPGEWPLAMAGRLLWRGAGVVFGLLLFGLLTRPADAQGPYAAQIQSALRAFLTQAHTWTGTQSFAAGTFTTPLPAASGGTGQASYAIGDLLYASGATTLSKLADVAAGSYLRAGGVTTAPVWSTLTLPNAATQGDLLVATGANAIGSVAAVATGQVLTSAGAGTVPAFSPTPSVPTDP